MRTGLADASPVCYVEPMPVYTNEAYAADVAFLIVLDSFQVLFGKMDVSKFDNLYADMNEELGRK